MFLLVIASEGQGVAAPHLPRFFFVDGALRTYVTYGLFFVMPSFCRRASGCVRCMWQGYAEKLKEEGMVKTNLQGEDISKIRRQQFEVGLATRTVSCFPADFVLHLVLARASHGLWLVASTTVLRIINSRGLWHNTQLLRMLPGHISQVVVGILLPACLPLSAELAQSAGDHCRTAGQGSGDGPHFERNRRGR